VSPPTRVPSSTLGMTGGWGPAGRRRLGRAQRRRRGASRFRRTYAVARGHAEILLLLGTIRPGTPRICRPLTRARQVARTNPRLKAGGYFLEPPTAADLPAVAGFTELPAAADSPA
jgi:hypothetical protein